MSSFLLPKELLKSIVITGEKKAATSFSHLLILGILAGFYIGFASHLATTIGTGETEWLGLKKFMMGSVFTVGLVLVIIAGSELWTGNNLMIIALFQKKIKLRSMLRNWFIVYLGNFIGSILLAFIISKSSGLLDGAIGGTAIKIAYTKVAENLHGIDHNYAYFFRAIGCNCLVCLGIMLAMSTDNMSGKVFGIFFTVMAFVASGFEHCIANMYFISAGIFATDINNAVIASGIDPTELYGLNWTSMWTHNILIVTLGNFVGGSLVIGGLYWYVYIKEPTRATANIEPAFKINNKKRVIALYTHKKKITQK